MHVLLWSSLPLGTVGFYRGYPSIIDTRIVVEPHSLAYPLHSSLPSPSTNGQEPTILPWLPPDTKKIKPRYVAAIALMEIKKDKEDFALRRLEKDVNYNGYMDSRDK